MYYCQIVQVLMQLFRLNLINKDLKRGLSVEFKYLGQLEDFGKT